MMVLLEANLMENFSSNKLAQISFLFGNKGAESFQLKIDKIYLE